MANADLPTTFDPEAFPRCFLLSFSQLEIPQDRLPSEVLNLFGSPLSPFA